MTINANDLPSSRRRDLAPRERFSTDLFTGVNIVVFLVLAASVVAAGVLYSQGA